MYPVDEHDRVREIQFPEMDFGAPEPRVTAEGGVLCLTYWLSNFDRKIVVTFESPECHYLGPPNDEALAGHPLAERGLHHYGVFEVDSSSWVRALERANQVHDRQRPEAYADLKHYVFTFHDETFECIASGLSYAIAETKSSVGS